MKLITDGLIIFGFDPLDVPTNYRGLADDPNIVMAKNHLNTKASINEIIEKLTNIGLEVEDIKEEIW